MGSFNVAATMSKISLNAGDKVVFIPLLPRDYGYKKEPNVIIGPQSMVVSNDGAPAYYTPSFLPIFGEYNDYGSIEDIERDKNVDYIEKYFGITIEDFMEAVTRNWCRDDMPEGMFEEREDELKSMSGMFEHREIYDKMVQAGSDENSAYKELRLSSEILEEFGFKIKDSTVFTDPRYDLHYEHEKMPQIVITSDGKYGQLYDRKTKKELPGMYSMYYLDKLLLENYNIQLNEIVLIDTYKNTNKFWYEIKSAIQEIKKRLKERQEILDKKDSMIPEDFVHALTLGDMGMADSNGLIRYFPELKYAFCDNHLEALADLFCFNSMMYRTNTMYIPAMNGPQFGDHYSSKKLYEASLKIVNEKIIEYEEY